MPSRSLFPLVSGAPERIAEVEQLVHIGFVECGFAPDVEVDLAILSMSSSHGKQPLLQCRAPF
jgi:hypothetical protein